MIKQGNYFRRHPTASPVQGPSGTYGVCPRGDAENCTWACVGNDQDHCDEQIAEHMAEMHPVMIDQLTLCGYERRIAIEVGIEMYEGSLDYQWAEERIAGLTKELKKVIKEQWQ